MYFSYSASQIQSLLKSEGSIANPTAIIEWILIDSRKIIRAQNSLFFALKGKIDSHQFIPQLINEGVLNFVIDNKNFDVTKYPQVNFFLVNDSNHALQVIATYHRNHFSFPIIGITGSNGKTIVKDWLYQLLSPEYSIVRSPKSYNSQIGVPISIAQINASYNLGIFEAGISTVNEMENLKKIIQPTIGVLTNIKTAHDEGFRSKEEKFEEKMLLFKDCSTVVIGLDYIPSKSNVNSHFFTWSITQNADLQINSIHKTINQSILKAKFKNVEIVLTIPFIDDASIENAIVCWAVLLSMGYDHEVIEERFYSLQSMPMRLELKQGINQTSIINDSYSADIESLYIAVDFLVQQQQHQRKTVILSDIVHAHTTNVYADIANYLQSKKIDRIIGIGEEITRFADEFNLKSQQFFPSIELFLEAFPNIDFHQESILVKGGRAFAFEKIVALLEQKVHETVLEINLNAIVHNLNFYRSKVNKSTKIMAMVKAYSYGSGSFEIANLLAYNKVDYLAVAYVDEGVALRKAGIKLPIMVMSPEASAFDLMVAHQLEPEIYSQRIFKAFIEFLDEKKIQQYPIHLKLDTGMHRLGFEEIDIPSLKELLGNSKSFRVVSVFSHLAASDDPQLDQFTKIQLKHFDHLCGLIRVYLGYDFMQHVANTAAILRFPEAQYDMVRLGIGMYGVENVGNFVDQLQTVGTLKTTVTQLRNVKKEESIGYSRKGLLLKDSVIATVKIGYADGYSRAFGNGIGEMLINGSTCPVIGNVCMDMCMLDVTGIDVKEGDEVIVFGNDLDISLLAKRIGTIPYELLTSISQRVKRIYHYE